MCSKKTLILLLLLITHPAISWSDTIVENVENSLSLYRVTAGVSVNSIDIDVYNEGSSSTNGTLSEDFSYTPYIILGSPYKYFGESNWGGLMEYSYSTFNLSQQTVNDELVDLGTSVKGHDLFVTPTVFYSFFGQNPSVKYDHTLIAGLGVGIGYLKATGDIIFTESTQERHEIDVSGAGMAISIFMDYRIGNFSTRISGGGTSYTQDNFDYDAFAFSWDFGYTFGL
jgi:hypothetical protein